MVMQVGKASIASFHVVKLQNLVGNMLLNVGNSSLIMFALQFYTCLTACIFFLQLLAVCHNLAVISYY